MNADLIHETAKAYALDPREETLEIRSLNNARAARARKGKAADLGFKPNRITRVE